MEKNFEVQEQNVQAQEKEMAENYQVNVNYFGSGRFSNEYDY